MVEGTPGTGWAGRSHSEVPAYQSDTGITMTLTVAAWRQVKEELPSSEHTATSTETLDSAATVCKYVLCT